jgi:hypothetical protein
MKISTFGIHKDVASHEYNESISFFESRIYQFVFFTEHIKMLSHPRLYGASSSTIKLSMTTVTAVLDASCITAEDTYIK